MLFNVNYLSNTAVVYMVPSVEIIGRRESKDMRWLEESHAKIMDNL